MNNQKQELRYQELTTAPVRGLVLKMASLGFFTSVICGVVFAQPVSDVLSFLCAVFMGIWMFRKNLSKTMV